MLLVGAGLSGIGAAYYLQTHCRTKSFTSVEAREEIGGTWDLFRYHGVSSDMYTFGYSFRLVHSGGAATSTVRNALISKADPPEEEPRRREDVGPAVAPAASDTRGERRQGDRTSSNSYAGRL